LVLGLTGCPNGTTGNPTLTAINVTPPTKTAYTLGEAFSSAGLAVTAVYDDGSSADVTADCTLSWTGGALAEGNTAITAAAGQKTVTLTYGEQSATFTITVSAPGDTSPGKVTGLEAAASDRQVTLTWTDPADADLASIEITWTPGNGSASVTKGTQTYIATGLTNDTEYTFTVQAKDAAGNLSGGETVTATPADPGDNTVPGKVTALEAAAGDGRVTLTWTDPADADLDSVEITWTPGNGSASVLKGIETYTAEGLTNGTEYTFTVKSKDNAEKLSDGETVTATPAAAKDSTAPGKVTGLSATKGNGKVRLDWTDPTDADLKEIEITWTGGSASVLKGIETYIAEGLTNGTEYTFTVKAKDNAGNSNTGETVTETPEGSAPSDLEPPGEVSGLATVSGYGEVTLTWTDPTDADLDTIEITWEPGSGSDLVAKGTQTYTATGLTGGTPYTFTVKTKDDSGNLNRRGTSISAAPKGAAKVSVNFGGLPQDETITLSGVQNLSQAADDQLTASVSGSFTAYRWVLDGLVQIGKTGSSLTLEAGDLTVKQHELTVFVTTGGVEYAKAVKFTVTN
jgi:hypothetical protein